SSTYLRTREPVRVLSPVLFIDSPDLVFRQRLNAKPSLGGQWILCLGQQFSVVAASICEVSPEPVKIAIRKLQTSQDHSRRLAYLSRRDQCKNFVYGVGRKVTSNYALDIVLSDRGRWLSH